MLRTAFWLVLLAALVTLGVSLGFERVAADERLDPEPHREAIRAVEAVLYRDRPAELGDGDRAALALEQLAVQLAPPDAPYLARRRALRLYELMGLASSLGEVGYALPDLGLLRIDWERERDALFAPAPWFARARPAPPR